MARRHILSICALVFFSDQAGIALASLSLFVSCVALNGAAPVGARLAGREQLDSTAAVPKRCLQLSNNSHRSWFVARSSSGPTPIAGSGARDRYGLALAAVSGKLAKYRRHLWRPPHFVPDSPGMAELAYSSKLRYEAVRRAGLGLRICCRTMGGARCSRMVPSVMAALCDVRARGRREGAPRCQPAPGQPLAPFLGWGRAL